MIKWPEPIACYAGHRLTPEGTNEFYGYADTLMSTATMLYTEEQLKQAVRDAIEEVAKRVEVQRNDVPANGFEFAAAIRALIKEIPQ